ncbi:MAG: YggS family pyridoxal phosphate-dependent enzyme [Chitinivibrionales bacterium]|nr:YggS family pyridoxal phosphate-dependent enzyme [Chitinivibrionales bacterium]MBD3395345.1 YggS family pyridoxal phosphate-dependent enzyme [Chitinivibrionales bacterium]
MAESFQERLKALRERISAACARSGRGGRPVRIVAVTKTHPAETVQAVIDAGLPDIGENRVQEIMDKAPGLTGTRCLHMVGHLQTNKVAKVVPLVDWIQSVDSARLADKIETQAAKAGRSISALVQVNTSGEESKSGCAPEQAIELCERVAACTHVSFHGLMTVGPLDASERETKQCFERLRNIGESCRHLCDTVELSMGMSDDFEWAIEEGATIIRVGSLLLGARPYP